MRFKVSLSKRTTKSFFQHGMAYGNFKDIPEKIASDKTLYDKAFNIVNNPMVSIWWNFQGLASMICKFFQKETVSNGAVKGKIVQNQKFEKQLHKPIIRKF